MATMEEVKGMVEQQGAAWQEFKKANDARLSSLEGDIAGQFLRLQRENPFRGGRVGGEAAPPEDAVWQNVKTGGRIPVLEAKHSLAAIADESSGGGFLGDVKSAPSVGRVLRGIVMGGKANDAAELADERKALSIGSDPSGGYTVQGHLASQWIDALRSQMVLTRAGCLTVPMDSKSLTIARVNADPTCYWHAENAALQSGELTFGAVDLQARTVVCLVKLSLEISQDSANIEQILSSTITSALAHEIDRAGLNGSATDAALAPVGILNQAGNSVTSIGAPADWDFLIDGMYELAADNVSMADIGALVAHPALWRKMAKLKTGITNDNTPLPLPTEVAALPKLWTTAAPLDGSTATGIIGNWRDLIFGVRSEITLQVLTQTFMGSNLQLAVLAYARCDFAPARVNSFCTLEGITVS